MPVLQLMPVLYPCLVYVRTLEG